MYEATARDGWAFEPTISLPAGGRARAGLVPLHPSGDPSRDQPLFLHLAGALPPEGIAVLRYDRRPGTRDIPLRQQAKDALAALALLGEAVGDVPLGLWGFSQGAWAAPMAAADDGARVAFLVLVAAPGVSPAAQMRYGTAEQLRRAGHSPRALIELAGLRAAYEDHQRGVADRAAVQALIDRHAQRAWFPLAWVPRTLPEPGTWADMDLDPTTALRRVRCPTLLVYGADDEWTPVAASLSAWRAAAAEAGNHDVTARVLPGLGHAPVLPDGSVAPAYDAALREWLATHVP